MAAMFFAVPFKTVATSSTATTVVGTKTPSNQATRVIGVYIGCDGTNSANGPAIMELCTNTFATNAPGTNSTSVTPVARDSGRPETIQNSCGKTWTAEPTVVSACDTFYVPSYMGSGIIFYPLTAPLIAKGGNGASVRVTQQSGVSPNVSGALICEE